MASFTHLFVYVVLAVMLHLLTSVEGGGIELRKRRSPPPPQLVEWKIPKERLNKTELACVWQQKVLFTDGQCYHLVSKGPCNKSEWLVLDDGPLNERGRRSPVCQLKKCPQPLHVFWPPDGKCHRLGETTTLCPYGGNFLHSDSFGDGECGCKPAHASYELDVVNYPKDSMPWQGICYPLYHTGPCRGGNVLHPKFLPDYGTVGHCVSDPCRKQNAQNPRSTFVQLHPDGECYKLGEFGPPCDKKEKLVIHPLYMRPACSLEVDQVIPTVLIGGGLRCEGNYNAMTDECRKELELEANTLEEISYMMSKRRPSRRG